MNTKFLQSNVSVLILSQMKARGSTGWADRTKGRQLHTDKSQSFHRTMEKFLHMHVTL